MHLNLSMISMFKKMLVNGRFVMVLSIWSGGGCRVWLSGRVWLACEVPVAPGRVPKQPQFNAQPAFWREVRTFSSSWPSPSLSALAYAPGTHVAGLAFRRRSHSQEGLMFRRSQADRPQGRPSYLEVDNLAAATIHLIFAVMVFVILKIVLF